MVWAAFGYHGIADIVFIDQTMKSENYLELLKIQLLSVARTMARTGFFNRAMLRFIVRDRQKVVFRLKYSVN
jgi:hypothetical protein